MLVSPPWKDEPRSADRRAWRFSFDAHDPAKDDACRITLPIGEVGEGTFLTMADACKAADADAGTVLVVGLSTGPATPYDVRQDVEAWVQAGPDLGWPALDVNLRARVMWRGNRIAIFGVQEHIDEALPAAVALSWMTLRASRLENEIKGAWGSLAKDSGLTHSLSPADLKHQAHVDAMTRLGWRLRMEHLNLKQQLEHPVAGAPGELRLFRELTVQSGLADRLSALEDPIECIQDLYESANDRLSEFRYFRREYAIEVLILIVLLAELLLMGLDWVI
jgi:hypothetical protein